MEEIKIIRTNYDHDNESPFIRIICIFHYLTNEIEFIKSNVRYIRNTTVMNVSQFKSSIYFKRETKHDINYYEELLYNNIIDTFVDIKKRNSERLEHLKKRIEKKENFINMIPKSYKHFHRKDKIKKLL